MKNYWYFRSFDYEKHRHLAKPAKLVSREPEQLAEPSVKTSAGKVILKASNTILEQGHVIIVVQDLINPHRFWFVTYSDYKELDKMMQNVQDFYNSDGDALKIDWSDLQPELTVAVSYYGIWHRGKVIKVLETGMIRVIYTDFGTVDDVALSSLRILLEDFLEFPSILKRGILSHVQPANDSWSTEAINLFRKRTTNKKIEAKIFKYNPDNSSYYLSLKTCTEKLLLADELITEGFCIYDQNFLTTKSEKLLEFSDYESGKLLEQSNVELNKRDSWIPLQECSTFLKENSEPYQSDCVESMQDLKNSFRNMATGTCQQQMIDAISTQPPEKHQVVPQSLNHLIEGSKKEVYIHSLTDNGQFYFYLKSEFPSIRLYLEKFKYLSVDL